LRGRRDEVDGRRMRGRGRGVMDDRSRMRGRGRGVMERRRWGHVHVCIRTAGVLHPCVFWQIGGGGRHPNDWTRESREIMDGFFDIFHHRVLMVPVSWVRLEVEVFLVDGRETPHFWYKAKGVIDSDLVQETLQ